MGNVSDYCRNCGNLKEHCTCDRGGGPWYTLSGGKKLSYDESETIRKEKMSDC